MTIDKTVFVLSGTWDTGKTTTLAKTRDLLLKLPDATETKYEPDYPDFICTIKVRDICIGIVSDGDMPEKVKNAIKSFRDENCYMIICACHTRNTTNSAMNYIYTLCEGYNFCRFRTFEIQNTSWLDDEKEEVCKAYNNGTAKVVFDMVERRISAVSNNQK